MEPGKSVKPAPGQMGPGGASTSPINLGGGLDAPKSSQQRTDLVGATVQSEPAKPIDLKTDEQKAAEAEELKKLLERKQLDALMQDLKEAINKSQALQPFKDQLLLDITPEGLRIQIIDSQNRPMFDLGSARLKPYTAEILHDGHHLPEAPCRTASASRDTPTPRRTPASAATRTGTCPPQRANAARRAMEESGLPTDRISRVVGLASSVLFDRDNPRGAVNRRISIVVLTQKAEQEANKTDLPATQRAAVESNVISGNATGA